MTTAPTIEAPVQPYTLFRVEMVRTERISPSMVRVTWLCRGGTQAGGGVPRDAITRTEFPAGRPYFSGYWLLGGAIE